jgi:hypothetical protein
LAILQPRMLNIGKIWTRGSREGQYVDVSMHGDLWPHGGPVLNSVAEPHHFFAVPAPGENLYTAPASEATVPAPIPYYMLRQIFKKNKS